MQSPLEPQKALQPLVPHMHKTFKDTLMFYYIVFIVGVKHSTFGLFLRILNSVQINISNI